MVPLSTAGALPFRLTLTYCHLLVIINETNEKKKMYSAEIVHHSEHLMVLYKLFVCNPWDTQLYIVIMNPKFFEGLSLF